MSESDTSQSSVKQNDLIDLTQYTLLQTPTEQQQYTVWRYTEWLSAYPLHIHTVLDYFKYCPFYDRQCNNELIATQQLATTQLQYMTGIEYQLHTQATNERLIINKLNRLSKDDVELIQSYYISTQESDRGTVYILPYLYDITQYNIQTSLYYLTQAVNSLSEGIQYNVGNKFYQYNFKENDDNVDMSAVQNEVDRHEYTNLVNDNIRLLLAETATNK